MTENSRGAILRRTIETCIRPDDDAVAKLSELFCDEVTVWSPNMLAVGLADLAKNLAFREKTFSDVDIQVDALSLDGETRSKVAPTAASRTVLPLSPPRR